MHSRTYYFRRILFSIPALTLIATAMPPTTAARYSQPDTLFVANRGAEISTFADSLLALTSSHAEAYDNILAILLKRGTALQDLGHKMRITSFDAIETQDRFDAIVLDRIAKIMDFGRTLPPPPISNMERKTFFQSLGVVPSLGYAPTAYLVIAAVEAIGKATEVLRSTSAINPDALSSLSLDMITSAFSQLRSNPTDDIAASQTEGLRQDSVVERVRCPKDGSNYRVRQIKNKLFKNDRMATIYELRCNICYEDRELWFRHRYMEKLLRAEKSQNLKTPPKKVDKSAGLEP